jgi:F-type H+-transporting ATPase subunit b
LTSFRLPFFLALFLCLGSAFALPGTAAWGLQAAGAPAASEAGQAASPTAGTQQNPGNRDEDSGENLYRHSASVKFLARWLHLDDESAARLFEYLNFAILAGAVLYALAKILPKTFKANREDIQRRLVEARTATAQANERLAAIEQRLGRLDDEIAAISTQAEKDSVDDEARIKATIEGERQRIVEALGKDIAAASSAAQRDLKRFAAGLAVDRARQRLALTAEDDRSLVQEFVHELAKTELARTGGQHTNGRGES